MEESYGVAAFRSRQQVLVFNNALQRAGSANGYRDYTTDDVVRVLRQMNTGNLIGVYRVEVRGAGRPTLSAIAIR